MEENKPETKTPTGNVLIESWTLEGKPTAVKEVNIERGVSVSRICKLLSRSGTPNMAAMELKRTGKTTFDDKIVDKDNNIHNVTRSFEIRPFPL